MTATGRDPIRRFRHRAMADSLLVSAIAWVAALPLLRFAIESSGAHELHEELVAHLTATTSSLIAAVAARWAIHRHHRDEADGGVITAGASLRSPLRWRLSVVLAWSLPTALLAGAGSASVVLLARALQPAAHPSALELPPAALLSLGLRTMGEALLIAAAALLLSRLWWRSLATPSLGGLLLLLWRGHQLFPLTSSATGIDASDARVAADEPARFLLQGEVPIAAVLLAAGLVAAWLACSGAPEPPHHRSAPER